MMVSLLLNKFGVRLEIEGHDLYTDEIRDLIPHHGKRGCPEAHVQGARKASEDVLQ